MTAPTLRRHFTVDDYYRMAAAGILRDDDRVELIDGEIVNMSPVGALHASCVDMVADLLASRVPADVLIRVQNPVRLSDETEPEPDLALVARRRYRHAHPTPPDIFLLIEVADSSVDYDREIKAPLYAREGVPELWVIDLIGEAVERYSAPSAAGYGDVLRLRRGEIVASAMLPSVTLAVDDILG